MAENGDRHALECHLALSRNRPEVGGWPGPMAITMLRRVGLQPWLHRRGPEAVAKPPPRWLLYSEGDPTAGLCMVAAGAQSRKTITCRRQLGTRS